ncbi:MAG: TatD family hydrolase [Candidatus Omnitrophica bacterium]|nr:TatD family hydrolase [Candidatus Omnitrophota bacterium]MBU4477761.1 TatD family hydrolase [Candidatus Omnitrophota bacterium]
MIDFHSHLDLYQDSLKLLPEVAKRNIFTLVVTTSPRAWQATSQMFSGYENIKVALGLHPEVAHKKAGEVDVFMLCIEKAKFIGEIGLDGSPKNQEFFSLQKELFSRVLSECEKQGGRILSIHSRCAGTPVLDLLEKYPQSGKQILHWFSGTTNELQRAITIGCWFSVGPAMILGTKGRELIKLMPREKVLPETDGPFVTNGKSPIMPWETHGIISFLADIWSLNIDSVKAQLRNNLELLIS